MRQSVDAIHDSCGYFGTVGVRKHEPHEGCNWLACHCCHIREVNGKCLAPDRKGGRLRKNKIHPFGEDIFGNKDVTATGKP